MVNLPLPWVLSRPDVDVVVATVTVVVGFDGEFLSCFSWTSAKFKWDDDDDDDNDVVVAVVAVANDDATDDNDDDVVDKVSELLLWRFTREEL